MEWVHSKGLATVALFLVSGIFPFIFMLGIHFDFWTLFRNNHFFIYFRNNQNVQMFPTFKKMKRKIPDAKSKATVHCELPLTNKKIPISVKINDL